MYEPAKLLNLTGANKRFWIRLNQTLRQTRHALGASRMDQALKLVKRTVERPGVIAPLNSDKNGTFGLGRRGNDRKPSH